MARTPELATKFPTVAAISNALAHHMVGIAVLAANSGHADSAGKNGHDAVAGHAIGIALPKAHVVKAMLNGILAAGMHQQQATGDDDDRAARANAILEKVKTPFCHSLYDELDVARMPETERTIVRDVDQLSTSTAASLPALALEGTSPVAVGKLHEPDSQVRLKQLALAQAEKRTQMATGPSVSRNMSRLHISTRGGSQFYKDILEVLVSSRKTGTFQSPELRELGFATAHWVLAKTHDITSAGVSCEDLTSSDYSMLPLWKCGAEDAAAFDTASAEVLANTLPVHVSVYKMTEKETATYRGNVELLGKLSKHHSSMFNEIVSSPSAVSSSSIITLAAMLGNEKSLALFIDTLLNHTKVACRVVFEKTPGVIEDAEGADVGMAVRIDTVLRKQ